MNNTRSQQVFLKQSAVMVVGSFIAGLLGYCFHILASKFLSVSAYGDLQALLSLFVLFSVPTQAILLYVTRRTARAAAGDVDTMCSQVCVMRQYTYLSIAIAMFVYIALLPLLQWYTHIENTWSIIAVIVLSGVGFLGALYQGVQTAWHHFSTVSISGVLNAGLKLLFAIVVLYIFGTVFSVVVVMIVASMITLAYLYTGIGKRCSGLQTKKIFPRMNRMTVQQLWTQSQSVLVLSFALAALASIDVLLAKHFLSPHDAGIFAAYAVLGKIIFWIAGAVIAVLFPRTSVSTHEQGQRKRVSTVTLSYGIITTLGALLLLIFTFFSQLIIHILFDASYVSKAGILWLFGLAALLLSFITLEAYVAYARNDRRAPWILVVCFVLVLFVPSVFGGEDFYRLISSFTVALAISYCITLGNRAYRKLYAK